MTSYQCGAAPAWKGAAQAYDQNHLTADILILEINKIRRQIFPSFRRIFIQRSPGGLESHDVMFSLGSQKTKRKRTQQLA